MDTVLALMHGLFFRREGFTQAGMAIALLLSLVLVVSSVQLYRIHGYAQDIQESLDAATLAAQEPLAHYYTTAQACDAFILSSSVLAVLVAGIGVVCLCVPPVAGFGESCIQQAERIFRLRDSFAEKTQRVLTRYQAILPFLCILRAREVLQENSQLTSHSYQGIALPLPLVGDPVVVGGEATKEVDLATKGHEIKELAQIAEEESQKMQDAKEEAFAYDCGNYPGRCMYERAGQLSAIRPADNPLYTSSDTWEPQVALRRAQAYYAARLRQEVPDGGDVESQGRSELRRYFYTHAQEYSEHVAQLQARRHGAVSVRPLPASTEALRDTSLYTQKYFPVSFDGGSAMPHAWPGCPRASSAELLYSFADLEPLQCHECPECHFVPHDLVRVAQASSVVDTGFEYHYNAFLDALSRYEKARDLAQPAQQEAQDKIHEVFSALRDMLKRFLNKRLEVYPPGRHGVICLARDESPGPRGLEFSSHFVDSSGALGERVAISASCLVALPCSEQDSLVLRDLDRLAYGSQSVLLEGVQMLSLLWTQALQIYARGADVLHDGLASCLNSLPLVGASGLGTWAADALSDLCIDLGFEPVPCEIYQPMLINSLHVARSDTSPLGARLVSLKAAGEQVSNENYQSWYELIRVEVERFATGAVVTGFKELLFAELKVSLSQVDSELISIPIP